MIRFQATKPLHAATGPMTLDLAFECPTGSILAIYGPSGAGKTTILRILAGLTPIHTGRIEIDNTTWQDTSESTCLPPQQRQIGFVFQDFALFPNLTVRQNLEYALPNKKDLPLIDELLTLMQLEPLQPHLPPTLSGGQQQRVALARAIARRPRLLLLDEALSALDDEMRVQLQDYILKAHARFKLTTILVSHYIPEILRLANKVIVLEKGKIARQGPPTEIFLQNPDNNQFRIIGEIANIHPSDIDVIVTVLTHGNTLKIIAPTEQAATLRIGDKVILAASHFSPSIIKIE